MPRSYTTITLAEAKQMLSAGEAKAASLGIAYNIAVVDAGGHLVAFVRQDGALIDRIDLAIDKAVTARLFDKTTAELATFAQSGKPLFGIQETNSGRVVIFGGGVPIMSGGNIIGAVGTSAGTVEQDIEVAQAASAALENGAREVLQIVGEHPRSAVGTENPIEPLARTCVGIRAVGEALGVSAEDDEISVRHRRERRHFST